MQEVTGSIPVTSTNPESLQQKSPSSRGLGHRPFTAVTGVRIPVGTPVQSMRHSAQGAHTMSSPHIGAWIRSRSPELWLRRVCRLGGRGTGIGRALTAGLAMATLVLAAPALSQTINTVAGGGAG